MTDPQHPGEPDTARTESDAPTKERRNVGLRFPAAVVVVLLALVLIQQPYLDRPFMGLHSWAEAMGGWQGRCHVVYGLGYTKGVSTLAVGHPPPEDPKRYWDHPQGTALLNGLSLAVLGVSEWAFRVGKLVYVLAAVAIFMMILRGLYDEWVAMVGGLLFVLLPITAYFGTAPYLAPLSFGAIYLYLVCIGEIKNVKTPGKRHLIGLAVCLLLAQQIGWQATFYAGAIGIHYVARCAFRRTWPRPALLGVLAGAPALGLAAVFLVMAGGFGWQVDRIVDLFIWRAGKGEQKAFEWGAWWTRLGEHAVGNFTLPVLGTVIAYSLYLVGANLWVLAMRRRGKQKAGQPPCMLRHASLLLLPAILQLFILKGALWMHQYWERPLALYIAAAGAMGVLLFARIVGQLHRILGPVAAVMGLALLALPCWAGIQSYYGIWWQHPAKIAMLQELREVVPPEKLLAVGPDGMDPVEGPTTSFIVNQHASKGEHLRPEVAWYVDRPLQLIYGRDVVERARATGATHYLMPAIAGSRQAPPIMQETVKALARRCKVVQVFEYQKGQRGPEGRFYRAGMMPYILFDLHTPPPRPPR
jgi:hypothetical protein